MAGIEVKDGKIYVDGKEKKLEELKKVPVQELSDEELEPISGGTSGTRVNTSRTLISAFLDGITCTRCGETLPCCLKVTHEYVMEFHCSACGYTNRYYCKPWL